MNNFTNLDSELELSVLFVEDENITREYFIDMLSCLPLTGGKICNIYTAKNGKEGLEIYKRIKPDIILSDIKMPVMDGLEMSLNIRQIDKTVKIIIITAHIDTDFLLNSIDIGINHYILKPLEVNNIKTVLDKCTATIQLERRVAFQNEKLRSLTSELILTEEKEKHRLATNLHDTVSQNLALALIRLEDLKKTRNVKESDKLFKQIQELIEASIEHSRNLTFELSPPVLYELGIETALEWLAEDIQKKEKIKVNYIRQSDIKSKDENLCIFLYRSARELLMNVVKHSHAISVQLVLHQLRDSIVLKVEDNGDGFDSSLLDTKTKFGLFSIKERIMCMGGDMTVKTEKGKGTSVKLTIPFEMPKAEATA